MEVNPCKIGVELMKHHWSYYPLHVKFEESRVIDVEYTFYDEITKSKRRLCKTCLEEGHDKIQQSITLVHDCKAVFYDKSNSQRGQCSCCCSEHGVRENES